MISRCLLALSCMLSLSACGGGSSSSSSSASALPNSNDGTLFTVTTQVVGNGTITPASTQVMALDSASFTVSPAPDTGILMVTGCGGSLTNGTYATGPITADCTVTANFAALGAPSTPTPTNLARTYLKASNTDEADVFGRSAAVNEDGSVLVVGAPGEQSADGSQADNSRANGAAYVFENNGGQWAQTAYIKPAALPQPFESPSRRLGFGDSVSINDDGSTIAVAAPGEATLSVDEGAVYIFDFINEAWVEQAVLKVVNADGFANRAGFDVPTIALDGAGDTLIVGEFFDSSITNSINGSELDDDAPGAGAAHVFVRETDGWTRQAFLKGSAVQPPDQFGSSVAISGDGNTVAVGSPESNPANPQSGSVYIFTRVDGVWMEQQRIQPATDNNQFGTSVSLSEGGDILAVGVIGDNSTGTGVNSDPATCCVIGSGAAFVFARSAGVWSEQAYIKANATDISDLFGRTISIDSDGRSLVVGAIGESGGDAGINGDPSNNERPTSGAAYLFTQTNGQWMQTAYLKSTNPIEFREFGEAVHISGDGTVILVGESREASNATGVDGDSTNADLLDAGAVHLFTIP